MRPSRKAVLIIFLICIIPFSAAEMNCHTDLHVDSSGDGFENIIVNSPSEDGRYFPTGAEWKVSIPKRAEKITLNSNTGADLRVEDESSNKMAYMTVTEDTSQDVRFNISMEIPRAATLYEDRLYLEQNLLSGCPDGNSAELALPSEFSVESVDHSYEKNVRNIVLSPLTQSRITLVAQSDTSTAEMAQFETPRFTVKAPEAHENYVRNIKTEAESHFNYLNSLTGLEAPRKLNVTYVAPDHELGFEDGSGKFTYPNKVEISSKLISRRRIHLLETLTHEIAHGHSHQMLEGDNWWWEEGSAQYLTYQTLESEGYNTSVFHPSREEVQKTFKECFQKNFINRWNPVESNERSCENGLDYNNLGYDHSYLIIKDLAAKEPDLIRKIYSRMNDRNVNFTEDRDELSVRPKNNQINYFASQVVGEDVTSFLRDQGVETVGWQQPERQLDQARNRIETLEGQSEYRIFDKEREKLDELYSRLYRGLYDQESDFSSESSDIVSDSMAKAREYNRTMNGYRDVESRIEELESSEDPELYTESSQQLEQALEHIQNTEFEQAGIKITQASAEANQTSSEIGNYRQAQENLESKLENSNPLVSPFMFKSEELVQRSESSFSEGEVDQALNQVRSAENYNQYGLIAAVIFYILLVLLIVWIWRKI